MNWSLAALGAYFVMSLISQTVNIKRSNAYLWWAAIRLITSFGAVCVAGELSRWYGAVGIAGATVILGRLDHCLLMVGDRAFREIMRKQL